jgi:hypothetical protein
MTDIEPKSESSASAKGGAKPIVPRKIFYPRRFCLRFIRLPVRHICQYLNRQDLTALATVGLAAATTLLAVWTHHDATEQAQITSRQLSVMEADQRPWVSIQPNGHSGLTWDERGMRIAVEFSVKNVGKSPATNFHFEAKLVLPRKAEPIDTEKMMTDYADELRKRRASGRLAGDILYPDQPKQLGMSMLLTRDEIQRLVGNDDGAAFIPRIIACADYTFVSGDNKRSCTSAYISQLKSGAAYVITIKDGDLPSDRVEVSPTFYNYAD